jgi:PIN domain nuclease of toxin-antitoxin system
LLLDTHAFIWACEAPERLSDAARRAIVSAANSVMVSAVTAWEIAIKCSNGRLRFPLSSWDQHIARLGGTMLAVTAAHGIEAGFLPRHHLDPFDRMLIAQARVEGLTLVTADPAVRLYDVAVFGG